MSTAVMTPRAQTSLKTTGRAIGLLLLAHLFMGLWVPFLLLDRVRRGAGFLANAAGGAGQVRAAVLLLFLGSALAIAITAAAWPVVRRHSPAMAVWLVALSVAAFSLQAADNGAILAMLSFSQQQAQAGAPSAELSAALGMVVTTARRWAHYMALLVAVSWITVFSAALFRLRLVPRLLAALPLVTSLLQIGAVSLRVILGYPPIMELAMPLAPAYIALALWLAVKGFDEGAQLPARSAAAVSA